MANLVSYCIYPITIALTVILYAIGSNTAENLAPSAFSAIILGVIAIASFEYFMPKHLQWRPRKQDVKGDLLYTALIQIALPQLLSLLIVFTLAEKIGKDAPFAAFWPREWPLAAQALLLIVSADFMRYWLHRLSHTTPLLWRLHAVHHSPDRLYWLNTSRFHPIEKVLQYFLDSLPFILMGVDPRVIGFWFVVYSVNGFFQHSNIQLRFGFLSSLFSTAELHRWHHSKKATESNANYANVFILWDRLFGSYYRPKEREVATLGLVNRAYPMDFLDQLKTPFIQGLDQREIFLPSISEGMLNFLVHARMQMIQFTHWKNLVKAAHSPGATQLQVLQNILRDNSHSRYGLEHGFSSISSYEEFVKKLPITSYEELRPYIEEQLHKGKPALTVAQPVMYAKTSGTTSQPKYVPIIEEELRRQRRHTALLTYCQYKFDPLAFSGKILAIVSPAEEGRFENGIPWGSTSGLLYASASRRLAAKYVIPPEVFEIEDYELKYHLILRLALAQKNITHLSTANPSTLLKLHAIINDKWQELIDDIEQGCFNKQSALPSHVMQAVKKKLRENPMRAAELRKIFESHQRANFAEVWPFLRLVVTWTSGNCAVAVNTVRHLLASSTSIIELGYLSSEFLGTLTVDCKSSAGLPTIESYFFEFIEPEKWEAGSREFQRVHEIENGRDYYVVITTPSGLYRYFMHDIVRVTGKFQQTPTLRFLQKGKGVTNITGEKLYENQVIEALKQAENHFGFRTLFFLLLAVVDQQAYRLYLETDSVQISANEVAHYVDEMLTQINIEYRQKRESKRLLPLHAELLIRGTGEAYRNHCVNLGQKEGQYKIIALQYAHDCKFSFTSYLSK